MWNVAWLGMVGVAGVLAVGCGQVSNAKPAAVENEPVLTAERVLEVGDAEAADHLVAHDPETTLDNYPDREPVYDPGRGEWVVHYNRVPNRHAGDHFSIVVDDETEETRFRGGR